MHYCEKALYDFMLIKTKAMWPCLGVCTGLDPRCRRGRFPPDVAVLWGKARSPLGSLTSVQKHKSRRARRTAAAVDQAADTRVEVRFSTCWLLLLSLLLLLHPVVVQQPG